MDKQNPKIKKAAALTTALNNTNFNPNFKDCEKNNQPAKLLTVSRDPDFVSEPMPDYLSQSQELEFKNV